MITVMFCSLGFGSSFFLKLSKVYGINAGHMFLAQLLGVFAGAKGNAFTLAEDYSETGDIASGKFENHSRERFENSHS